MKYILLISIILKCRIWTIDGFNVDAQYTVKTFTSSYPNSQFGYAVAIQNKEYLMVGAPFTNTSDNNNPGALMKCSISNNSCNVVPIAEDTSSDIDVLKRQRTDQRMGMSVSTQNEEIFSCAPLWHKVQDKYIWFFGRCHTWSSDYSKKTVNSPCINQLIGNTYYGYCEAGLSSSSMTRNNYIYHGLGLPGAHNFKGALSIVIGGISFISPSDQLNDVSSLMGYSIAGGRFTGEEAPELVGGAPRADLLSGKVIIYQFKESPFTILLSISCPDSQVGQYFGASVAAVDLDGDGKDDLLVGAPFYSSTQDEGRVYVYMNVKGKSFSGFELRKNPLEGDSRLGAKFGSSIANLGDINNDGFGDVAIGAPFGGIDGKGAIYIYNGGLDGIRQQFSQVIQALGNPSQAGFGHSISPSYDIDSNGYPDFAVGSYMENKAFVFRTRVVVSIKDSLRLNVTSIIPEPEYGNCVGPDKETYQCAEFSFNLTYDGKGTPNNFDMEITLETDKAQLAGIKRAFVLSPDKKSLISLYVQNVTLSKGSFVLNPVTIYFKTASIGTDTIDIDAPVLFTTAYKAYESISGCGNNPCPVLNLYSGLVNTKQISYLKHCGNDSKCDVDLQVKSSINLPSNPGLVEVLYGVVYDLQLEVAVENKGEPAYQARINLEFNSDLKVVEISINTKPYILWQPEDVNATAKRLSFPIANPLQTDQMVTVIVKFSINRPRPTVEAYTFGIEAKSSGDEKTEQDNKAKSSINTKIATCVRIQGDAKPSAVTYEENVSLPPSVNASVADVGQEVNYTFFIQNAGKTPVDSLNVSISIVVKKDSETDLVYVVDLFVSGVQCSGNKLNPNNYTVLHQQSGQQQDGGNNKESSNRKRRAVSPAENVDDTSINCRNGMCQQFTCHINSLDPGKGAPVFIITRLWAASLKKLKLTLGGISTKIKAEFDGQFKKQYIQDSKCNLEQEVLVTVRHSVVKTTTKPVEWWIILLAVLGALVLLAIVIAVLYSLGFFKRKDIKNISGPTDNDAVNPQNEQDDDED